MTKDFSFLDSWKTVDKLLKTHGNNNKKKEIGIYFKAQ